MDQLPGLRAALAGGAAARRRTHHALQVAGMQCHPWHAALQELMTNGRQSTWGHDQCRADAAVFLPIGRVKRRVSHTKIGRQPLCSLGRFCIAASHRLSCVLRREGLEEVFDAVVTDPPYGVRAGARKSVHLPYKPRPHGRDHFPHTDPYTLGECLLDLLDSAARLLRVGGRLVYFLPVGV
jgi:hypothetical protein